MNLVSIIVPVYNVEKYLARCVESIIGQDYNNLEIILVDDGSNDSSGMICDRYSRNDDRVKVIHQTNGGMSAARNAGLDIASGDYIMFVDSDDEVVSTFVSTMLNASISSDASLVQCGFRYVDEEGILLNEVVSSDAVLLNHTEQMKEHLNERLITTMVWDKLYKADLLRDLRFPVGKYHEDIFFIYKVLHCATTTFVLNKALYNYRQVAGSIMHRSFNNKHLHSLEALQERKEFIAQHYPELLPIAEASVVMGAIKIMERLMDSQIYLKDIERNLKRIVNQNILFFLKYSRAATTTKLFAVVMCFSTSIARKFYMILRK